MLTFDVSRELYFDVGCIIFGGDDGEGAAFVGTR
jgi:hypothetical protein